MRYFLQVAALLGFVVLTATPGFAAELRGHWTLDNLTTGIQNQGTDGATSDLTSAVAPTVAPGIIGGALQFAGLTTPATNTTILRTTLPGNAGDDLADYPFAFSSWINKSATDPAGDVTNFAMGVTQQSANNVQYGYGLVTASGQGTISARNTAFEPVTAGPNLIDGQWHHIVGVFNSTSSLQLYADGVLIATDPFAPVFNTGVNHLYIGGMVRANTDHVFEFGGRIDDAGLFTGTLTAGDVGLIHALGRVAGIGLDQFDEAQALLQQSVGSTATFGGYDWKHVTGLSGSVGTYGGSAASFDAFIVTGPSGAGLMMFQNIPVPEPSTGLLLMLGTVLLRHRKRSA